MKAITVSSSYTVLDSACPDSMSQKTHSPTVNVPPNATEWFDFLDPGCCITAWPVLDARTQLAMPGTRFTAERSQCRSLLGRQNPARDRTLTRSGRPCPARAAT